MNIQEYDAEIARLNAELNSALEYDIRHQEGCVLSNGYLTRPYSTKSDELTQQRADFFRASLPLLLDYAKQCTGYAEGETALMYDGVDKETDQVNWRGVTIHYEWRHGFFSHGFHLLATEYGPVRWDYLRCPQRHYICSPWNLLRKTLRKSPSWWRIIMGWFR